MNTNIVRWQICPYLHAMSDFGFKDVDKNTGLYTYGRSHTNNAECYADKCRGRGRCLIAVLPKKTHKEHQDG